MSLYRITHPATGTRIVTARNFDEACWLFPGAYSVAPFSFV